MAFTSPYGQHNYMGEFANDAAALTFIQDNDFDTNKDGTGSPEEGMWYFNTTSTNFRGYRNGAWRGLNDADNIEVDATGFSKILSGTDTDVQTALDTLDQHTHPSTDITDFDEAAQDAVGGILVDSATIDFTYDDGVPSITAIVIDGSIDVNKLATNIDATGIGFNADQVDGADLNDAGTSTSDLWSAAQIQNAIDQAVQGTDFKESVRAATTAAGTLASDFEDGDTIDGVTLATGDRILIKDQASAVENGIYIVQASGAPVRAEDLDTGASAAGAVIPVEEGTTNADQLFICTSNNGSDVVGTDTLTFTNFGFLTAHNSLSGLQGGNGSTEFYHLTLAEYNALTSNGGVVNASAQHIHDDIYYTETELSSTTGGSEGAALIGTDAKANLGGATTVEAALEDINTQAGTWVKIFTGAGNPNGSVTPDKTGDLYVRTTGFGLRYISIDGTNTGWRII